MGGKGGLEGEEGVYALVCVFGKMHVSNFGWVSRCIGVWICVRQYIWIGGWVRSYTRKSNQYTRFQAALSYSSSNAELSCCGIYAPYFPFSFATLADILP